MQDAEIARLREDAERYRWLRKQEGTQRPDAQVMFNIGHDWVNCTAPDELDAAIDAARKETK